MPDTDERDRIRAHFADRPGEGLHAERAANELENALAYGHESDEQRARDELKALGWTPVDERRREEAAQSRRDAAQAKKAERDAAKNGDQDDDEAGRSHEAPQGRSSTPPTRQTTAAKK